MSVGQLAVRADLVLEAAGLTARLTGDGTDLTLESSDPLALWRSAAGLPWPAGSTVRRGPRVLGDLAGQLAAHGLHLDVTGPHGRVAELGAGVRSPLGRLLTGSAGVRPGSVRTVGATLTAGPGPRRVLVAGAVVAALAVLGRRRGRR